MQVMERRWQHQLMEVTELTQLMQGSERQLTLLTQRRWELGLAPHGLVGGRRTFLMPTLHSAVCWSAVRVESAKGLGAVPAEGGPGRACGHCVCSKGGMTSAVDAPGEWQNGRGRKRPFRTVECDTFTHDS